MKTHPEYTKGSYDRHTGGIGTSGTCDNQSHPTEDPSTTGGVSVPSRKEVTVVHVMIYET